MPTSKLDVEIFNNEMDTFLKAFAYSVVEIYATQPTNAEQNATQPTDSDEPLHVLFLREMRMKHLRLVNIETPDAEYLGLRVDAVNQIHDSIATLAQNRLEQMQRQA